MLAKPCLYLLILSCLATSYAGEIYKWVDENGKVHYGQTPPAKQAEKVKLKSTPNTSSVSTPSTNTNQSSAESQRRYSDYLEQERLERQEKREQEKQEKAEIRAKCRSAQMELNDLQEGGFILYELDENGERVYLSDEQYEQEKQKYQTYLDKNCRGFI